MEQAKGSKFLKVTGILMIVFGAIAIVLGIIAVLGVAAVGLLIGGEANMTLLYVAAIFALVGAVAQFIAGIVGVKNCNKPEKAGTCITWGIITAVLSVLGCVLTPIAGGDFSLLSLALGLVIPVLYIIGAAKNKQA